MICETVPKETCSIVLLFSDRGWWNVTFIPSAKLTKVLIGGQSSRLEPQEVIVPMATDTDLSISFLKLHLQNLEEELHCHACVYVYMCTVSFECTCLVSICEDKCSMKCIYI